MAPRKKPTSERRSQVVSEELADVLAETLVHTCELLDELLAVLSPTVSLARLYPIVERMEHYLNRRGKSPREPAWVARMRETVTRYKLRAKLTKAPTELDLH